MSGATKHTLSAALTSTLKQQRSSLVVEPIHATYAPVRAYADQVAALKGEPFDVVTIPEGSAAYCMGYRFVSVPRSETAYYVSNGAAIAAAGSQK